MSTLWNEMSIEERLINMADDFEKENYPEYQVEKIDVETLREAARTIAELRKGKVTTKI